MGVSTQSTWEDRINEKMPATDVESSASEIEESTAKDDYMDEDPNSDPNEVNAKDAKANEIMKKLAQEQLAKENSDGFDDPSHDEEGKKSMHAGEDDNK